jgi:hypothetical protein
MTALAWSMAMAMALQLESRSALKWVWRMACSSGVALASAEPAWRWQQAMASRLAFQSAPVSGLEAWLALVLLSDFW